MKKIHWFFFLFKLALLIQFALVFANKHSIESEIYIASELGFKVALAVFIEYFLYTRNLTMVDSGDKIILSLAGGILLYDAFVNDLPHLLSKYGIAWNVPFLRQYKQ